MKCLTPISIRGDLVPCNTCYACQTNNRNAWDLRLRIEALNSLFSWFVTLTFRDECLPPYNSVIPAHLSRFIKDLRNRYRSSTIRYYGIGEYGELYGRPHYHLLIFSDTDINMIREASDIWSYGFTDVGSVEYASIHYVTKWHIDPKYEEGHPVEIHGCTRMSKGIGRDLLSNLDEYNIRPNYLLNGKLLPIHRYYRKKLNFVVSDIEDIPTYISRKYNISEPQAILNKVAQLQDIYNKKQYNKTRKLF